MDRSDMIPGCSPELDNFNSVLKLIENVGYILSILMILATVIKFVKLKQEMNNTEIKPQKKYAFIHRLIRVLNRTMT